MRRDRFVESYPAHLPDLLKLARKLLEYDEAADAVSLAIHRIMKGRAFRKIRPKKIKSFLCQAVRYECHRTTDEVHNSKTVIARLPDEEDASSVELEMLHAEELLVECPFCFQANLNEYGACAMCGTIVPSHYRTQQNVIRMDKASLVMELDFNRQADVAKALAQLTPKEQLVMRTMAMGNETLDSLAMLTNHERMDLWRTFVIAKRKLQALLHEYDHRILSKTSSEVIYSTFKSFLES